MLLAGLLSMNMCAAWHMTVATRILWRHFLWAICQAVVALVVPASSPGVHGSQATRNAQGHGQQVTRMDSHAFAGCACTQRMQLWGLKHLWQCPGAHWRGGSGGACRACSGNCSRGKTSLSLEGQAAGVAMAGHCLEPAVLWSGWCGPVAAIWRLHSNVRPCCSLSHSVGGMHAQEQQQICWQKC